jgi:hypothetical protein
MDKKSFEKAHAYKVPTRMRSLARSLTRGKKSKPMAASSAGVDTVPVATAPAATVDGIEINISK